MTDLGSRYGLNLLLAWSLALGVLLIVVLYEHHTDTLQEAVQEARNYYRLNLHYRAWNAQMSGVYVPADKVTPNPYLKVPNRDVTMSDGKRYTLINPAYMTRMVFERVARQGESTIISKLTSLKPLNPANMADAWETEALLGFEQGLSNEYYSRCLIKEKPYLRYIGEFRTGKDCLKCHEHQGYRVGDVRGGLSISIPLDIYLQNEAKTRNHLLGGFILLWTAGVIGISSTSKKKYLQDQALKGSRDQLQDNFNTLERAKNELQVLTDKLLILTNEIPAMIAHVDAEQRFLYANRSYTEWAGVALENLVGKSVLEIIGDDAYAVTRPFIERVLKGQAGQVERVLHRNGEEYVQIVTFVPQFNVLNEVVAYFAFITDITGIKRTEKNLRESEWLLRESQKVACLGTYSFLPQQGVWTSSDILDQIFGIGPNFIRDVAGWLAIVHQEDREMMQKYLQYVLEKRVKFNREYRIVNQLTQEVRWVSGLGELRIDKSGAVTAMIGTIQDITAQRNLEEQLRHSQKMEAVGQLAGGVAHDFNNILTVILGYCSLMRINCGNDQEMCFNLDQVVTAAERGANLTRGLLTFSRREGMNPKIHDLNEILQHVREFIIRIIGEDIQLETLPFQAPLHVKVDNAQIEQVLINLATNARDAMPKGGVLTLATEAIELDTGFVAKHGYGLPGRYAVLSVSDNGSGIDDETRKRIFDPFFTTKEVGKGTGLGLAIVYGTVKQHNGYINVYSEPGFGSTFRIYLPIVDQEPDGMDNETPAFGELAGNFDVILVVEDDPAVRGMVETVLRQFNYDVILAIDGRDGVRKFAENRDKIKMIVMDIIMPGMNGREACENIRLIQPDAKVIFTSGYAAEIIKNRGDLDEKETILMKPVQPTQLLRKIREILGR